MDSTDNENEDGSSGTDSEDDLPTEVPEDSVLYKGDEDDDDAEPEEQRDDSSISRRAVLGGLGVGGLAVGGALVFSGVLGGSSEDEPEDDESAGDDGSDDESADAEEEGSETSDPAVTFDNQPYEGDAVSVDVTAPGEYALVVTYGDDGDSIVAGTADASDLEAESVAVDLQDVSGVSGTHTAHLVEGSTGDYEPGDALTAETLDSVVVADTANVSGDGGDSETSVAFADQALEDGSISLELTTPDDHFTIVTYDRDGTPVIAGSEDTSNLDGAARTVDVHDRDGVPGEYTAHVLADEDGSTFYVPGDALSEPTADVVTASDAASVSKSDAEPEAAVSFEDQTVGDGSVSLTVTAPDAHFVLVTYRSGDDRLIAASDDVSGLDGDRISVDVGDDGGVGGLHSAYVIAEEDGSRFYETGDSVSEATLGGIKAASTATISE